LSGLRPSTVYLINVAAINAVGVGETMQFAFTTDDLRQSDSFVDENKSKQNEFI